MRTKCVVTVAVHDSRPMRQLADKQHRKVVGSLFARGVKLGNGVIRVDIEAKLYGTSRKIETQRAIIRLLTDGAGQAELVHIVRVCVMVSPVDRFQLGVYAACASVGVCSDMNVPVFTS